MTAEWRQVVGFEGTHEVSNDGRVRSLTRKDKVGRLRIGRELRPSGSGFGQQVTLHAYSFMAYRKVHHLVLEAFVGPRPSGMECCHNNGDWRDNRVENLRWDTHKSNMADKIRQGQGLGETHPRARLTETDVQMIRAMRKQGMRNFEIAKWFPVSRHHVGLIVRGKSWRHVA